MMPSKDLQVDRSRELSNIFVHNQSSDSTRSQGSARNLIFRRQTKIGKNENSMLPPTISSNQSLTPTSSLNRRKFSSIFFDSTLNVMETNSACLPGKKNGADNLLPNLWSEESFQGRSLEAHSASTPPMRRLSPTSRNSAHRSFINKSKFFNGKSFD